MIESGSIRYFPSLLVVSLVAGCAFATLACSDSPPPAPLDSRAPADVSLAPAETALPDVGVDLAPPPPPANCKGFAKLSGKLILRLDHGGRQREALVSIPTGYDATKPLPVVLNFHGLSSNASQQAAYTGLDFAANAAGMLAVHPQGTGLARSWNAAKNCCGQASLLAVDDVGFVAALLDKLAKEICVDPRRVFAAGMSNGAFFSYRLACALPDRIAAIAPIAGLLLCTPKGRAVPTFHFHGTADVLVAYGGNSLLGWPSVMQSVGAMAQHNGCSGPAAEYLKNGDVTCIRWEASTCKDGAEVRLCTIEDGGHTWPGGLDIPIPWLGKKTKDISATDEMIAFFKAHPMPAQ